ncbi:MAG: hypothetical protein AAGI49_05805 [Bacteroidota bacterium]
MKPPCKVLHDKAMEFVDKALLSKMEGNEAAVQCFLEQAFALEKEAALSAPIYESNNFARSLYLRSAAYLAFELGYLLEASYLSTLGLSEDAPTFVNKQLKALKEKLELGVSPFQLMGLFVKADAKTGSITVEDEKSKQFYFIRVPMERIHEIVKEHWFSRVMIEAKINKQGFVILEDIKAAA